MGTSRERSAGSGRSLGRSALLLTLAALLVCAVAVAAGAQSGEGDGSAAPRPADRSGPLADPHAGDRGDQLVVLFGDSFSEAAAPRTLDLFLADAELRLSSNVYGGTQLDTATWVQGYPGVEEGAVVLLLLGTNDISTDSAATVEADARAAIDAATEAGADRVVVATVNTTGRPPGFGEDWTARARAFNDWLRRADADPLRYPTLDLVDWDGLSRGRTDWLAADGVHHSPAGQAAYADVTHAAARAAAGLGPWPSPPSVPRTG